MLRGFFLRLVFKLAVIQNFTDRRLRVGRNLHQVQPGLLRALESIPDIDGAVILARVVDQLDLRRIDKLVDPRSIACGRLPGPDRSSCDLSVSSIAMVQCTLPGLRNPPAG